MAGALAAADLFHLEINPAKTMQECRIPAPANIGLRFWTNGFSDVQLHIIAPRFAPPRNDGLSLRRVAAG